MENLKMVEIVNFSLKIVNFNIFPHKMDNFWAKKRENFQISLTFLRTGAIIILNSMSKDDIEIEK
uniref:Uncharacterized protein n=1 Tax=Romanomermis culicivorax TaxID=13658 RepID=A0A915HUS4_ROMCU